MGVSIGNVKNILINVQKANSCFITLKKITVTVSKTILSTTAYQPRLLIFDEGRSTVTSWVFVQFSSG